VGIGASLACSGLVALLACAGVSLARTEGCFALRRAE
jgi:hypothetical protein